MGTDLANVRFEFDASCEKAWQDDKGKMHVRAVASDDKIDLQRDRMSTAALQKMAASAKNGVPFLETHRSTFEFGRTVGGEMKEIVGKDGKKCNQLVVDVELDADFPQARKLFKEVASGNCNRQLSIGGKLNLKNRESVTVEMSPSGLTRTINDLDLDHIASTREKQAANPRTTFIEAIAKALDDAGIDKPLTPPEEETPGTGSEDEDDVKTGVGFLASLGKMVKTMFGGKDMDAVPATSSTPKSEEEVTPKTPATSSEPKKTPSDAPKFGKTRKAMTSPPEMAEEEEMPMTPGSTLEESPSSEELARDIAVLLAKMDAYGDADAADVVEDEEEASSPKSPKSSEEPCPGSTMKSAVYNSLWTVRYLLAKEAGAEAGAQEQTSLSEVVAAGPFAPRSGAKGIASGAYIPDKAPKGDTTDVGTSGVTDARRNIQIGGEVPSTAPTAKEAFNLTMQKLSEAGGLPKVGDSEAFGKSLEKSLDGFLTKNMDMTKDLLTLAVEKVMEENEKGIAEVRKSVDGLGTVVNSSGERLASLESRLAQIEKVSGVSHSGPRGIQDSTIPVAPKGKGGVWGGIFDKATGSAMARY